MNRSILRILLIIFYYIIIIVIIYNVVYFFGKNLIFNCKIDNPKDLDCIDVILNSVILSYVSVMIFLIIDVALLKSYKITRKIY